MDKEKINHKYLLYLYSKVDDFLTSNKNDRESLPDTIVSFCIVVEKILKIKLHEKNPVLVFDTQKIKEDRILVDIVNTKEKNLETIKIQRTIERFKLIFKDIFSDEESSALLSVTSLRNGFVHSHEEDIGILPDQEKEDVIKKMGTIWEKILPQAEDLFGKKNIKASKPIKKYTENELEDVLVKEIKNKLNSAKEVFSLHDPYKIALSTASLISRPLSIYDNPCPRCGTYGFSLEDIYSDFSRSSPSSVLGISMYSPESFSNLYKCSKCGFELTENEYKIAKKNKLF